MDKISFKNAKDQFSKRAFIGVLIAIIICWIMRSFGIAYFHLDLENKLFNDISNFIKNNNLTNIYYSITLSIQVYLLYCAVYGAKNKNAMIYCLILVPFNILIRRLTSIYEVELGNLAAVIELVYLVLVTSKFNWKKMLVSLVTNVFIIIYQIICLFTRSLELQAHTFNLVAELILSFDLYLLLILLREVAIMNGGTWFFFGFTAWIYAVAGFFVGLFTFNHPIKKAKEYYAKGKAKEDARKTEKANKKLERAK